MKEKVLQLIARLDAVEHDLGNPQALSNQKEYQRLTREYSYLSQVKTIWESIQKMENNLLESYAFLKEEQDPEFRKIAEEEAEDLEKKLEIARSELQTLLVPPDPTDSSATIIELRAGTGGDEATLFVSDCMRMYKMFADKQGWKYELLSATPSEVGGYKEYVMVLSGDNVYRFLKYEAGTHRVQRVPDTESQGRVHTSAITIAVLLEPEEDVEVEIKESDLRVETFKSSGAGGQHVNTTDSAVRIIHLPTGVVVECQQERSQHKNKEKAMRILKAKIAEMERVKKQQELASLRSEQVGSGDRSERIRTYNFPQNRVTDHRINLTKHNLDQVMDGQLEEIVHALVSHFYQKRLGEA